MTQSSLKMRMLEAFRFRMFSSLAIVLVLFLLLIIQLVNIQLIQGSEYKRKSRLNMESNIPILAPRGEIYDRNFKLGAENIVIVSNRPSFNVSTIPANFQNKEDLNLTLGRLSRLLNIPFENVQKNIMDRNPWERVVIEEDVPFDSIVKIASHGDIFKNIDWKDEPVRVYNLGNMFFHSVGYVGCITKQEYLKHRKQGYKYYHKIGKSGIENKYDLLLRGDDGFIKRIVDVRNRVEGEKIGLNPVSGNNLILTIDSEIQAVACDAMSELKGAVVVIKPSSGEVLALVSKPDINPNLLLSQNNNNIIGRLSKGNDRPFLNRAIQTRYPPASTFKLVTSIATLEEEKWNPNWTQNCRGKYTLKGYKDRDFYCYKLHGVLDMYMAIARSCSVYFYQLGYKIGPTIILKYANYMGIGEKTGIDLPGEISGFVPSKQWKRKTFGQPWYDGDTINLSIGQGFISTTVIGMANLICGIVNNGVIYKAHLVKEIRSPDNIRIIKKIEPEKLKEIPLSSLTTKTIKTGMRLAVKKGTARRLDYLKIPIAGKTGTAQTISKRRDNASQHAWFASYAPYNKDAENAVVVVVLVEHGIAGAVSAVPVAEKIYLKLKSIGYF